MSSFVATLIALVVCIIVLLPVGWLALRRAGWRIPTIALVAFLLFAWTQTGILTAPGIPSSAGELQMISPTDQGQCREVARAMEGAGLSVDFSDPQEQKLVGSGADSLPPEVRETLVSCAKMLRD